LKQSGILEMERAGQRVPGAGADRVGPGGGDPGDAGRKRIIP